MGCYIWYSEKGPERAAAPPSPLLAVPNVTAHPSTTSVPITVLLHNGPFLCGFGLKIDKFGDDTKLFGGFRCSEDVERLQNDLHELIKWSEEWQMLFNILKCKVMHIGNLDFRRQWTSRNYKWFTKKRICAW